MSDLRTVRLRSGVETVNGITGETGPVFSEYVLLSDYQALQRELAKLRQMVEQQAEDEGLWFNAATAPEAYLQQELRKLHAAIEGTK